MSDGLGGALRFVTDAASETAHCRAVAALVADFNRTQSLLAEVMDWLETVPRSKARKRGSTHWRAGVAALTAARRLGEASATLVQVEWTSPRLELEMEVVRDGLWLATFDAGRACAWMNEAAERTAKGKVRSPETQARLTSMQRVIDEAASRPGSAAGIAGKLQAELARSPIHLDRKIRAARRRMSGSE